MTAFITKIQNTVVSGFFFLLPVVVVLVIVTKTWTALGSVGARLAAMFGMKSIIGLGATNVFTGLLMLVICLTCGMLVRLSFMEKFRQRIEVWLARYIPGYDTYKAMAEEKLQNKIRILPYSTALIKQHEYWQPAYVVEQDQAGNYVLFLPDIPETNRGHVLLASKSQVRLVPSVTANQLDASLKKTGKGLLTEYRIQMP
jgi:hypothetical protein